MAKLPIVSWMGNAAAVLVGGWGAVSRQARAAGCSRQTAYDHAEKVESAEPRAELRDALVRRWWLRRQSVAAGTDRRLVADAPGGGRWLAAALVQTEYCRRLSVYPHDGWLDIDNNEGENSLRGLCTGRRNWLFVGSDRGGRAAAIHFSLLASCKRHGHDPWVYYRDVLTRLPAILPAASEEKLLALLPHRWHPA